MAAPPSPAQPPTSIAGHGSDVTHVEAHEVSSLDTGQRHFERRVFLNGRRRVGAVGRLGLAEPAS